MLRKMLAIGYEQNEFEKICQCFMTIDQSIELVRADSLSAAASMLQSDHFDCMIARHDFLDYLPFINFLRSAETIPILLLTCDKVYATTPDILRFSLDYGKNIEREAVFLVMTPADIWEQKEINRRLYEAMNELTPQQRRRIYARFFLHMNNAEIARVEGCDITSVRDSINRGLRRLKKIFENLS